MKTHEQIEARIAELKADDRFPKKYGGRRAGVANVAINAPLALEQLNMEAQVLALEWVLKEGA